MDWKSFFDLRITRLSQSGSHPYFRSELIVPHEFTISELQLKEFLHFPLTHEEMKRLSLFHRKILLRLCYFHSREFNRIAENFLMRVVREKENQLSFSTSGGGIYLLLHLQRHQEKLGEKKIFCQTSELPLSLVRMEKYSRASLQLPYRPQPYSVFDGFPSLWQNSPALNLFEVDQENLRTA